MVLWAATQINHAAFVHPGLINNKADLEFMRNQVKAGRQPWKSSYDQLVNDMN